MLRNLVGKMRNLIWNAMGTCWGIEIFYGFFSGFIICARNFQFITFLKLALITIIRRLLGNCGKNLNLQMNKIHLLLHFLKVTLFIG
jgi:hypothetical protein